MRRDSETTSAKNILARNNEDLQLDCEYRAANSPAYQEACRAG
jgi:hypothetical protein